MYIYLVVEVLPEKVGTGRQIRRAWRSLNVTIVGDCVAGSISYRTLFEFLALWAIISPCRNCKI